MAYNDLKLHDLFAGRVKLGSPDLCGYQCPEGESSLSEETATAPRPPLDDARPSRAGG